MSDLINPLFGNLMRFFGKNYTLWEKTYGENFEESLPSGISESHRPLFIRNSVARFIKLVKNLEKQNNLPEKIYVYEKGPGSGIFAKGFLNGVKSKNKKIYDRLIYLLSDTSIEILTQCTSLLENHKGHTKFYEQSAFEKLDVYTNKILFARHSNVWGQFPCRMFMQNKLDIFEVYVKSICDQKFENLLKKINERSLEYVILKYPNLWKEFFRSIKLTTKFLSLSKNSSRNKINKSIVSEYYLESLQNEKLISEEIIKDLNFLNKIVDWKRDGYIEIVDLITQRDTKSVRPLKFDGAVSYKVNSKIIDLWGNKNNRSIGFKKIRKLNTLVSINANRQPRITLKEMFDNSSFEIFPVNNIVKNTLYLPKKSKITVTCTSDKGMNFTIETAITLKMAGFNSYPHIIAKYVKNEKELENYNKKLISNNVKNIFIAAGDTNKIGTKYQSSLDLLSAYKSIGFPFNDLWITGYPEGHPYISDKKLIDALKEKQKFVNSKKIHARILTQMCFDAKKIVNWSYQIMDNGIDLPIMVGIPGPCNGIKLLQFALKCGVGESVRFLNSKKNLSKNLISNLGLNYQPDNLIQQIVNDELFTKTNIIGFHFYTFNNLIILSGWLQDFKNRINSPV